VNLVAEYLAPNDLAHNVHVEGDYAFISHYTSGVAVLDIHDPTNPVEVAVYDTYVPNDDPQFAGCWGVYPHTSNGMVFTSNIEGYLNIFQFHDIETDVNEETALTGEFVLNQNYPNPFNPITTLRYKIPEKQTVSLSIFDLSGRLVETIFDDQLEPGTFKILWNASAHSSGVYFAILENGKNRIVQKLILLK
jgi:hypothetical protein